MRSRPLLATLAAAGALIAGACASSTATRASEAPAATTRVPAGPADSVESVCIRGDTTKLLVRSRRTGKERLERWLFRANGTVIDLATGVQLMDSAQAANTGIRDLLRQQQTLDRRAAELAAQAGKREPEPAACTAAP